MLDMTYGLGVFWRKLDETRYHLVRNDLDIERGDIHEDFRHMSFPDFHFDAVVLDPPYGGNSSNKNGFARSLYNNSQRESENVNGTLKFYFDGMLEAIRLLKKHGVLFVKCMDEIESGKQRRNHITIFNWAIEHGMVDDDLFMLVQEGHPVMRHDYQIHARKNNSFLWVFHKR